jgi:signal transduction histidine kinase
MIENVLLLARGGGAHIPLNPVPTALGDVVRATLEELEPLLERHHARVQTDVAAGAGAMIDAGAVRQVVVNLVDNALRYGPEGQTIRVAVRADDARAILTIRDEGRGIPPADRERVFQPFVRLDPTAATVGAGIGLALVRQLAQAMHGGVRIEDVAGPGLAITVWFPRAQVTDEFRSTRALPEVEHTSS